ncbi:D-amino-acid transaminase [Jeotgalibacillus proteolyticus]|uniref:D-alanine aminotransferase n=1 Tax=Jeotgalibacillus proteolyticus TaxID=2082395 RepID=A0A2S5GFL2_9BACL|nr:D-amino-acid transaminase [Jeotgalibacillus proteolyticus]PPA71694.1 D-amino-acid transaminase [Jeotgalibacillus proteolyticus]
MNTILLNDQFIDREQSSVNIEDRGYQFGDGVYEVIRIYSGKMFTGKEHITRLFESAEKIQLTLPFTEDELTENLYKLVEKNKLDTGIIYLQVTRGVSPRQHQFPLDGKAVFTAYTKEVARPEAQMNEGVTAIVADDVRWLRCDIKSLNLLGNLLAKQEAFSQGSFEAILHRDGTVTEGSSSNVFIIKNNTLYTHPATNLILNGITRREILRLCPGIGLEVKEESFTLDELYEADEVFVASTTAEIMPVIKVGAKAVGSSKPGEWSKKLQETFKASIQEQCGELVRSEV